MKNIFILILLLFAIDLVAQKRIDQLPEKTNPDNTWLLLSGNPASGKLYKVEFQTIKDSVNAALNLQWALYQNDTLNIKTNDTTRLMVTPAGILSMTLPIYADDQAAYDGGIKIKEWYQTSTGEVRQLNVSGNANKTTFLNNQFARSDIFEQEIGSTITINDTLTIPAGKVLKFKPGGKIVGTGVINGGIINAHHLQWIFDTTLTVNPEGSVDNIFSARWYGADPARSNNQPYIQKAINVCVQNYLPNLYLPRGSYNITKGLLFVADRNNDGNYAEQVTINFFGDRKPQAGNSSETIINCTHADNFAIGLVLGKSCKFYDLYLKGVNVLNYSIATAWTAATTYIANSSRDNQNSPYAGLVLDPFHTNTTAGNRYPGFTSYYDGFNSDGGSTDCTFENFAIDGFTVGVLLSPNGTTQNNESHIFDGFWLQNLKYGYVSCNSQERNVFIYNWKIWNSVKTCFANSIYGANFGDAPIINNINVAGNIFEIFNIQNVGYDPFLEVHSVHAESFYRIGSIKVRAYIDNSKFHFGLPYEMTGSLLLQSWVLSKAGPQVTFEDCTLFHYNDKSWYPFKIFVQNPEHAISSINFINCNMNPVSVVSNNPGNGAGSTDEYTERNLAGRNDISTYLYDVSLLQYSSWTKVKLGSKIYFNAADAIYSVMTPRSVIEHIVTSPDIKSTPTGSVTLTVASGEATFDMDAGGTNLIGILAVGMPIYCFNILTNQFGESYYYNHIGRVKSIDGSNVVTIEGIPDGVVNGSYTILSKYFQYINPAIVGDITSGSDSIKNVLHFTNFVSGSLISNPNFKKGTYVVSKTGTTLVVSTLATASESNSIISGYEYIESGYTNGNPIGKFTTNIAVRKGTVLNNLDPSTSIINYVCTRSGVFGTANPPEFEPTYKLNEIRFSKTFDGSADDGLVGSLTIDAITIPSGYFIEEVLVDVGAGLTGGGYITLGVETDDIDSGLNSTTGLVSTLNSNVVSKVTGSLIKSTASRALVAAVGGSDITAGTANFIVRFKKF